MQPLPERLAQGGVIVGDGAWGTMLMERGLRPGQCPEALNTSRPELLEEIARLYVDAGAELITTNTFGGSPLRLETYSLDEQTEIINGSAVRAARKAAGERAWVSASVGPSGRILLPYGDIEPDAVASSFTRQIRALAEAGADLICIETMTDLTEAKLAVEASKSVAPDLPVVTTMTFDPTPRGFFTVMGVSIEQAVAGLRDAGADIIGSNCGNGIENMVAIAREMHAASDRPLAIQSNAGLPENRAGEVVYPESPEFLAGHARELVDLGVTIIGGCCGTGPEHIRALRRMVDEAVAQG